MLLKVERRGTFGEYEVTGWQYVDEFSWHVKVWLTGHPRDWLGYTMKSGQCELNILSEVQPKALSEVIAKWEAQRAEPAYSEMPLSSLEETYLQMGIV